MPFPEMENHEKGLLAGYRILDLCRLEGHICGKLLGDLGADVIQVEPPAGDPARKRGPFVADDPRPEKSLSWLALNTSKRGITLDLAKPRGRELFLRLVQNADAVVESFPPGYLESIGLGYDQLCDPRPELIVTSIAPFGPTGPYSGYLATDITLWALAGLLFICGDPDRPPVRISVAQSFLHAGVDAAAGTVMALFHRGRNCQGQRVFVSALKSMERVAYAAHTIWDARGKILRRPGSTLRIPPLGTSTPVIWPCRDGYVAFYLFGGAMGTVSNPALARWMAEENLAPPAMLDLDWSSFDIGRTPQERIDRDIVGPIGEFFRRHEKAELWKEGVRRRVMVYPVNDAASVAGDTQLLERGFWVKLEHPSLGIDLTYPGPFVKTEGVRCEVRSPVITAGQDNLDIYVGELGLGESEIRELAREGII